MRTHNEAVEIAKTNHHEYDEVITSSWAKRLVAGDIIKKSFLIRIMDEDGGIRFTLPFDGSFL